MRPPVVVKPVEKLWPNSTVVCLGTGPSLTKADVNFCRDKARVIAINNAIELAPWADLLYAADMRWWRRFAGVPNFTGLKYSIMPNVGQETAQQDYRDLHILKNTGGFGFDADPSSLRTGANSGYQAMHLAVHLGATRIVLLGFDMHGDHFFGSHPDGSHPPFWACLAAFPTLVEPLKARGVEVVNCTSGSAVTCFPIGQLSSVLEQVAA